MRALRNWCMKRFQMGTPTAAGRVLGPYCISKACASSLPRPILVPRTGIMIVTHSLRTGCQMARKRINRGSVKVKRELMAVEANKQPRVGLLGLTSSEAVRRLATVGANEISATTARSSVLQFFSHFLNPLVLIL